MSQIVQKLSDLLNKDKDENEKREKRQRIFTQILKKFPNAAQIILENGSSALVSENVNLENYPNANRRILFNADSRRLVLRYSIMIGGAEVFSLVPIYLDSAKQMTLLESYLKTPTGRKLLTELLKG